MSAENWIQVAMSDDSVVAETLLRLRHAPKKSDVSSCLKLKWSVRQRRSKKGAGDLTRASPTTPLSLSGGATSFSGGEESSAVAVIPPPSEIFRSKVSRTSAITATPTIIKRSRKKKTLLELKDEEILLLKERKDLKIELANMRELVEQQKSRNNALKKMKAESQSVLSCKLAFEQGSSFLLPDLNMPIDNNDPSPEVVC